MIYPKKKWYNLVQKAGYIDKKWAKDKDKNIKNVG